MIDLADDRRTQLLQVYQAALQAVAGDRAVEVWLKANPLDGEWAVVAIGKAAAAMARGAQQQLGPKVFCGLVITKHDHSASGLDSSRFTQLESAHPVPDNTSLTAGETLLRFLEELPDGLPVLFLLSGGASALVEVLPDGMDGTALAELNRWLLGSGLSIESMNSIRKRLSRIKGGRLALYLKGRRCVQLLISDVPCDDPAVIGSGMLVPDQPYQSTEIGTLPAWSHKLLDKGVAAMPQDDPAFQTIETYIIASNGQARVAAADKAAEQGLQVHAHSGHFQGDAVDLAERFCNELLKGAPGIYIWGGESTVTLPEEHGKGGRNQHLALAAARQLAGVENILLLAAGTDGSDGPTEEAGALVDGETIKRGEEEGGSSVDALARCDAGSFLELSGDLVETGPTGTNVMDLVIGWRWD